MILRGTVCLQLSCLCAGMVTMHRCVRWVYPASLSANEDEMRTAEKSLRCVFNCSTRSSFAESLTPEAGSLSYTERSFTTVQNSTPWQQRMRHRAAFMTDIATLGDKCLCRIEARIRIFLVRPRMQHHRRWLPKGCCGDV